MSSSDSSHRRHKKKHRHRRHHRRSSSRESSHLVSLFELLHKEMAANHTLFREELGRISSRVAVMEGQRPSFAQTGSARSRASTPRHRTYILRSRASLWQRPKPSNKASSTTETELTGQSPKQKIPRLVSDLMPRNGTGARTEMKSLLPPPRFPGWIPNRK